MKKLISVILSIALFMGMVTVVNAAVTEINDGLADSSKMISSSGNLIFETKKLGSYQNAQYATSNAGKMEFLYELEGMGSFEVVTLNYYNLKDIAFYVSDSENGEYSEVSDYTVSEEDLGSSWKKITYSKNDLEKGTRYLKISVNQTKSKYIRLDNVKILAKFELEIESFNLFDEGEIVEGENIYGADELQLVFNQKVETIPELVISTENGEDIKVEGRTGEDNNIAVYEFEDLGFYLYSFEADSFKSSTGTECDFYLEKGYSAECTVPDKLYFGDSFKVSDFVKSITDKDGKAYNLPEINVMTKNPEIVSVEGDGISINKAGSAEINISFEFDGKMITIKKNVTVCDATGLKLPTESISLNAGEFESFPINIVLSDGTEVAAKEVIAESTDNTVAVYENGNIMGIAEGNAYIKFSVDYYGKTLTGTLSVGVGRDALDAISNVELRSNRDTIPISESIQIIVNGYFENSTETDGIAMVKEFFSSNEAVLTVSDSGKATGKSKGTADVYAIVTLGGLSVKSKPLTVTVEEDGIFEANIITDTIYMLAGKTTELSVKAYTKTGEEIENPQVSYKTTNSNVLTVSENILSAVSEGQAEIYATVSHNGKSVDTKKVSVTVKKSNGSSDKNFLTEANFNGVFEHSNGLYVSAAGGCLTNGTNLHNNYVVFEATDELKNIYIRWDSYGKNITGDIKLQVSADNATYTEVPESEISIKEVTCHVISSGQGYIFEYSGEKLEGVKYVKIFVDRMQGNTQITRLLGVRLDYDKAPVVIGFTGFDKEGIATSGSDAVRLSVSFSQDINTEETGSVSLKEKSTGKTVDYIGSFENGMYTLGFDKLSDATYTLSVSGFKNQYGTAMQEYSMDIEPAEKKIEVKNVKLTGTSVSANIVNNMGEAIDACVVTAVYNSKGVMKGIYVEEDFELKSGTTEFVSKGTFEDGSVAKVYIWSNMTDLMVY